ncbi:hypothetical protein [Enterobacter hormaechei]|uniref:hypothetical protein n=1 Tax=Enterobacter hormaechei TaxID=158836 RepID=UPI00106345B2|nr:hypothetical protein [Enterobacter hormaechei]MCC9329518.1 hypothetical protein [Enterobacter hormaechei subsp. steigerwaltii]MCC9335285.1 hypothetical protein [Enterobacter hormaechei subsp. steigerwaltii]MCC9344676.1 hypothetical protein [Enterobacter hormaechei subsp. steigerwaltii]MCC9349343.1 hypothetical protein [Enterobacter hormaechei subsp. steigerwaltii]MCC9354706.1 hypothetical protein [Enterobacter hormaechei subsp. steigerwaltii]
MNEEDTRKRSVISGCGLTLLSVFNAFTACFNALFCATREGFNDAWQAGERSPPLMTVQNMVQ